MVLLAVGILTLIIAVIIGLWLYQEKQPVKGFKYGIRMVTPELEDCRKKATEEARVKSGTESGEWYSKIWSEVFNECYQK